MVQEFEFPQDNQEESLSSSHAGFITNLTSIRPSIIGAVVVVTVLVYGAIRVKKAGASLATQSQPNTVFTNTTQSQYATAATYHTVGISEALTKGLSIAVKNTHFGVFTGFWRKVPTRIWNFYINSFLIPLYRKEWGKYRFWYFRSPMRPKKDLVIKAQLKKLKERKAEGLKQTPGKVVASSDDDENTLPHPNPHSHSGCHKVRINVGGCIYETQIRTLNRYPQTLLGDPNKRLRYYNPVKNEYFFDRNQASFETILYFYQSGGRFKRPDYISADILLDDAKFYGLPQSVIFQYLIDEGLSIVEVSEDIMPQNLFLRKIWLLFDHPQSSMQAQLLSLISVLAIVLSISTFCIETMDSFSSRFEYFMDTRDFVAFKVSDTQSIDLSDPFFFIETMCSIWFIVEYLARLASSPVKSDFLLNILNFVDLVAVLPFCVQVLASPETQVATDGEQQTVIQNKTHTKGVSIIRIVRLVRVFRIFKLSRHSRGLKILGKTLHASLNELALLVFFVFIGVILFSSTMYFAELSSKETPFESIPAGFWWALITITTVGYGDHVPKTSGGQVVGALCAIAGVLTLALPVPVIVSNFNFFYHQAMGETDLSWIRIIHSPPCPFRPMEACSGMDPSPYTEKSLKEIKRHHGGKRPKVCERLRPIPKCSSDEEFGSLKKN